MVNSSSFERMPDEHSTQTNDVARVLFWSSHSFAMLSSTPNDAMRCISFEIYVPLASNNENAQIQSMHYNAFTFAVNKSYDVSYANDNERPLFEHLFSVLNGGNEFNHDNDQ